MIFLLKLKFKQSQIEIVKEKLKRLEIRLMKKYMMKNRENILKFIKLYHTRNLLINKTRFNSTRISDIILKQKNFQMRNKRIFILYICQVCLGTNK